jgi:hypothetical protein
MNHLTTREIFQIVDGTIENGERTRLVVHLEQCQRCLREVELQRRLGQAVKQMPLVKPSEGFTAGVVNIVAPKAKKTWGAIIINNLASIIAMISVLSVVWYAVTMTPSAHNTAQPSAISKALGAYAEYYGKSRDAISKGVTSLIGEPRKDQPSKKIDVATLTVISLIILVALDRFVMRRVIRIRA